MNPMIPCPCCQGSGEIEERPKGPECLSPTALRIWEIVRRRNGISGPDLVNLIYADRANGGPVNARKSVHVTICKANKLLAAEGVQIKGTGGRGSTYHLVRTGAAK